MKLRHDSSDPATAVNRMLFACVNLLFLLALYFVFINPVQRMIADGEQTIGERRLALGRYEAVATKEREAEDFAHAVADMNSRGELLEGESDGVINANLQAHVKAIAEASGVTVRSIQRLPDKILQGVALFGARIDITGKYEMVHDLARTLESESPLLLISAANLRGQMTTGGVSQRAHGEEIEAQFDVFGGALTGGRP